MGWNLCNRLDSTEEYYLKMRIKDDPNEKDNLLNNWYFDDKIWVIIYVAYNMPKIFE